MHFAAAYRILVHVHTYIFIYTYIRMYVHTDCKYEYILVRTCIHIKIMDKKLYYVAVMWYICTHTGHS